MIGRGQDGRPRLQRSQHERVLFGVCGGLAAYFGVDPTVVRIGFVLAALFPVTSAVSLLGYVVLAVILPEEGNEDLPGRDRIRRNLEGLRADVSGFGDSVRSGLSGRQRSSRPADDLDDLTAATRPRSVGEQRDQETSTRTPAGVP
jgi:phage shock protein C